MKNIFNKIELVIFDLDGTLYEDTDHFDYYATLLKDQLDQTVQKKFTIEYEKMLKGEHIVSIGKIYDVVHDYVLKLDSSTLSVIDAWTWEGKPLGHDKVQDFYPNPIKLDFDSMIAIGDGWWLPNVCARHFGVTDTQSAYAETKDFMDTDNFQLTKIRGLKESLLLLKDKKNIALVTNSETYDVERILRNLDLEDVFENMITNAKKPQNTQEHFKTLLKKFEVNPENAISIGDNFLNEIAPAVNLGMNTVFLDMYDLDYPEYQGVKVRSISEILEDMKHVN